MKNIRLIVETEEDRKAILRCQALTNHATASKAILAVVRDYPAVKMALQDALVSLAQATADRDKLKDAFETVLWGDADVDRRINEAIEDGLARRAAREGRRVHIPDVDDIDRDKTMCGRQITPSLLMTTRGVEGATCSTCIQRHDFGTLT